jgi:hypothetical protein
VDLGVVGADDALDERNGEGTDGKPRGDGVRTVAGKVPEPVATDVPDRYRR